MTIREFVDRHYRHFNAAVVRDAARGWIDHLDAGGRMFLTLAGAMSTAELGVSLAEMIRQGKVHAICCTGANLEEDLFNLVAHDDYLRIPGYRQLTAEDEAELRRRGLNRVTDTCIPEEAAMRVIESRMIDLWSRAAESGERRFPHEWFYEIVSSGVLADEYDVDPADSWLVAAAERDLPLWVPGWEDSTLGNMFVASVIDGTVADRRVTKSGLEYMEHLVGWYQETSADASIGFFQIGGGIAGDFPICVVPLINQDLERGCPYWGYFCQISEAITSFGGYSGAVPSEKITWGKIDVDTPTFVIESDATIVAPLIFGYVLGW